MLDSTSPEEARRELRADVAAMRELHVLQWKDIVLAPSAMVSVEETTQRSTDPETVEAEERAQRRRISLASSGGPVKALGGEQRNQ